MAFQKGHTPWNKGLKIQLNTGRTHFKKGEKSWNEGKTFSEAHRKKLSESHMGQKAWNKGTKGLIMPNSGSFQNGATAPDTAFKKGFEPWNKGLHGYHSGEEHWNWKGGVSAESHLIRNSLEYKDWRFSVFERDDFTCQSCGAEGVYLNAHHIEGFADRPDKRFDIDNGMTLCEPCHHDTLRKHKFH